MEAGDEQNNEDGEKLLLKRDTRNNLNKYTTNPNLNSTI